MNKKQLKIVTNALITHIDSLERELVWKSQDLEISLATADVDTMTDLRKKISALETDNNFLKSQLNTARQNLAVCDPKEVFNIISPNWIRSNIKIEFIKLVRKMTNSGIKESKDLVEAFLADSDIKSGSYIQEENKS